MPVSSQERAGISPEEVQRVVNSTNWEKYNQSVLFRIQKPDCSPYDGSALCGHWHGWITSGRGLYPFTSKGEGHITKS